MPWDLTATLHWGAERRANMQRPTTVSERRNRDSLDSDNTGTLQERLVQIAIGILRCVTGLKLHLSVRLRVFKIIDSP